MSPSWQRALFIPLIVLAWLAILLIGGWLLSHVAKTILTLLLGGIVAFALTPLVAVLSRWMPRGLAIAVAYVLGFVVVLGLGALLVVTAAGLAAGGLAVQIARLGRLIGDIGDRDPDERLRFDVFDVVNGGGQHPLVLKYDAVRHFLRREAGVVPKNADDRDINVRENIGGRAQDRHRTENKQKNGCDDECIRPA